MHSAWITAAVFLFCYIALGALIYVRQEHLLYFPDAAGPSAAASCGLKPWPREDGFRGYVSLSPPESPKGTFVVWHGNGGSALQRAYFTLALERRGYRVLLAEYPGYGGRPGRLSEESFVVDALETLEMARKAWPGPVFVLGESLGCGVAAATAGRSPWVAGAALITPWRTLPDLAQSKYWYFPARWLVRDKYDNEKALAGFRKPVAVLLAGADEVIPFGQGLRLYESVRAPKRLWVFDNAGHNTWPADPGERWWDEVIGFLYTSADADGRGAERIDRQRANGQNLPAMETGRPNYSLLSAAVILLAAAWLIILFWRGFSDPDEGRYAEIPREMVVSGNWMEMRMLGYRYYEKPPMAYWLVAPAIQMLGARDWAVRVPLLFSGLLGLAALSFLAFKKMGARNGSRSILVMASTIGFISGNGLLLTDSFLLTFFAATCVFLYLAFEDPPPACKQVWLLLAAAAAALGFLTKGAVAVVLPAAIVFIWLLWEGRLKDLFRISVLPAAVLAAAMIAAALWAIEQHNPGFTKHFIVEEHIARFQGTRATQLHPEPFWFFLMVLPLLLLPWVLFVFRAVRSGWKEKILKNDPFARFLAVWSAVVVCFFSLGSGKLMSYILPAIPPLALLVGRWGMAAPPDLADAHDRRLWRLGACGPAVAAAAIIGVWIAAYFQLLPGKIYAVSGASAPALIPAAVAFLFILVRGARVGFEGLAASAAAVLLSCALLLSPLAGADFNVLLHINSSHVYKSLAGELKPEDRVISFWSYRPALAFYTGRLYALFQEKNELIYGMQMEPERRGALETAGQLEDFLRESKGRVFALVEPQDLKSKFPALNLNFKETGLPRDPDTVVYELAPAARGARQGAGENLGK